jgi:hypothetical protein
MDISLGSAVRVVISGAPRARSRYGVRADGTRGPVGPEIDGGGTAQFGFPATLAGGLAGWVEGATVVVAEPLVTGLPPVGTLVELSGALALAVRGGDFGSTRATVTGVSGVRALGSAVDALAAVGGARRAGGDA